MNNGYSICFNKWALDPDIKNELRLLVIISSLTAENGYCFASNKYFSKIFDETEVSISNKIKRLEKNNYIEIEYERRGAEIINRKIRLKNILIDEQKIFYSTIKNNFKDNNTSNNNTSINKKEIYKERFKKPSYEEVKEYCLQRNNNIDPKRFLDFYEVNNWTDSNGNKVKSWKQKIITWETHQPKTKQKEDIIPDWFNKDLSNPDIATASEMNKILEELQQ